MGTSPSIILQPGRWKLNQEGCTFCFVKKVTPHLNIISCPNFINFSFHSDLEHRTLYQKNNTDRELRGYRVTTNFTEITHTTRQSFPKTNMTTDDRSLLLFLPYLMDQQKQYNKYKTINSIHKSCECLPLQNLLSIYYHPISNHFLQFPFRRSIVTNNLILQYEY